ncbi:hypothetical protein C8J56DRAFT_786964 [Mycena floridula]|nr:hypothetical protein C8J56DRAFT_786964 [Mycena floridula]
MYLCLSCLLSFYLFCDRTPRLITDKRGRIIAFLLGQPDDLSWLKVISDLMVTLRNFRNDALRDGVVKAADFIHRRGFFLAIARGYSFGGGRMKPGNTVHSRRLRERLDKLYENTNLIRVAGGLASFAPKIFHYMKTMLKKLSSHSSGGGLLHNFKNSAYPMCTINFGPETACFKHTDDANGAGLLCLVTAVSNHNPQRGGHMVLYSLKLMVEFPSGSTIGLPSASVPHGNTPIQDGEERYSVTQYCPGGLLRWVHYGFRTVKTLLAQNGGKEEKAKLDGKVGSRWEWALGLFSKVYELDADREALRKGTL